MDNVPPGRVLVVANHSGQIPLDGLLIGASLFLDAKQPRLIRTRKPWARTSPPRQTRQRRLLDGSESCAPAHAGTPRALSSVGAMQEPIIQGDATRETQLRKAILAHLRRHPMAADTAEGIVACWLPPTGFEDAPDYIQAVLADMVALRSLNVRHLPDGVMLYSRGAAV